MYLKNNMRFPPTYSKNLFASESGGVGVVYLTIKVDCAQRVLAVC